MSPFAVSPADIEAAASQLADQIVRTPTVRSVRLSTLIGADVFLKLENLQATASFKARGALIKLLSLGPEVKATGVIAMSAGNHAQGVAYHAQRLGIPATIVMPLGTPTTKIQATRGYGAAVALYGETLDESKEYVDKLISQKNLTLIHPYDDPAIIAGQGTAALELLADQPDLEVLVVPIGGGGLIAGSAIAATAKRPGIEVLGVEAQMFPSMHQALAGLPIKAGGPTLAEGIAVKSPGKLTLPVVRDLVADIALVGEVALERAVAHCLEAEKLVVEGAGAAGVAALLADPARFKGRRVGIMICGGNIDSRLLSAILMRTLIRDGRLGRLRIEINDRPGALAAVTKIIAEHEGNIVEVAHQRLLADIPAKLTELEVLVETRDPAHLAELVGAMEAAGYPVTQPVAIRL
ncbi:MAG: threonine ammonia-lyase [Alphaproteobacteria bacterium]